LKYYF